MNTLALLVLLIPAFAILWHMRRERRKRAAEARRTSTFVMPVLEDVTHDTTWTPARHTPRPAKNMTEMYERARWKCERCGHVNECGTPTCICVSSRRHRR